MIGCRDYAMGEAIAHVWKALDVLESYRETTIEDLADVVDQAQRTWSPMGQTAVRLLAKQPTVEEAYGHAEKLMQRLRVIEGGGGA